MLPANNFPRICSFMNRIGLQTDAFAQLTTSYMNEVFNREVPDDPDVSYDHLLTLPATPSNALLVLTARSDTIPMVLTVILDSTASGEHPTR